MSNGVSSSSQSAVIRARYMPDVRGVNRPLIIDSHEPSCNIDKKPRELPYIECGHDGRRSPSRTEIELVITSNVDDGRCKGHSTYQNGPLSMTLPQLPSTTKLNGKLPSSTKRNRSSVPSSKTEQSSDDLGMRVVRNQQNLYPENTRCLACKTGSNESSERCRSRSMNSLTSPRSFGYNGAEKKMRNITALQNKTAEIKPIPKLVGSKSAQNIDSVEILPKETFKSEITRPVMVTNEVSTQTDNFEERLSTDSSTSMDDSRQQKATQTHNCYLTEGRSKDMATELDYERTELYDVIDSALHETFDKYSRLRANQFIASSARKQAQIWRDAKEFVSTVLLPDGVALANRTKAARNASLTDALAGYSLS